MNVNSKQPPKHSGSSQTPVATDVERISPGGASFTDGRPESVAQAQQIQVIQGGSTNFSGGPVVQARHIKGTSQGDIETEKMTYEQIMQMIEELEDSEELGDHRIRSELRQALVRGEYIGADVEDDPMDDSFEEEEEEGEEDNDLLASHEMDIPMSVYDRYADIYGKDPKHKGKTLDPERLKQNTTAVAVYEKDIEMSGIEDDGEKKKDGSDVDLDEQQELYSSLLAQRSYPGMLDIANEQHMELRIAKGDMGNIHAEMLGLSHSMDQMVSQGIMDAMLHVHPSQSVCFFCEVMLRLFNVNYDQSFTDKRMFGNWVDPTGMFRDEENDGLPHTPRTMLQLFSMDVEEAVQRVLPLFQSLDNPRQFVDRILDGSLQGGELKKLVQDLKNGSKELADANKRGGKSSSSGRAPGKNTKAGRRLKRQQQKELSERNKKMKEKKQVVEYDDPVNVDGVGVLQNVHGDGMNCLIRSVLRSAGVHDADDFVLTIRNHLIQQGVAAAANMLDLVGAAGGVLISYLVEQGTLQANRGIIVHSFNNFGVIQQAQVLNGGNPIHLWLNHNHFQAIIPL